MTGHTETPLTFREIFNLPVSVDLKTAARAFGMCRGTAYRLIALGTFPCETVRVGGRHRVLTVELLRALGIEERPVFADEIAEGVALTLFD
ncbi:helix-turn-helix transcriptional regulator [Streptomyces telluris]|uniref:Helix-turn-helix domain-containing protein n=1 Tax=Streptomyces telluris TaxID=2720021 RepID=A0A9X2LLV7_9ACTN|nr:helix-turn-helix domain-containing protein [Streptomyces telluris]MCQ8773319.1 helix-turn-helix domain-containing protein [Streptomyces telluris]NJP79703.1 helix-turn-helix domain-containing protein [Streptomyces telluris]